MFLCGFLIGGRLLLFAADNMLNGFRQLRDVPALGIFANFCGILQVVKVGVLI